MGRIQLKKVSDRVAFRKMAVGSWGTASEASVYSYVDVDMTETLKFISEYNEEHQVRVTPTHFAGYVIAKVIEARPEINSMLRWSAIYQRENVGVFFLVNVPCKHTNEVGNSDLSGCTVHGVEKLSLAELVHKIQEKVERVREKNDQEITGTIKMLNLLPWFLARWALKLISFLNYSLNIDLSRFGIPRNPFGCVMVTNVGSLGIDNALIPLAEHTRSPLFLSLGKITERPWVVDEKVVPRPVMTIGVTFDHRLMDGSHGASMVKLFKSYFDDPWKSFGMKKKKEFKSHEEFKPSTLSAS